MECTLCKKQYVGKAETAFNILLNNHRDDVKNPHPKTILACKHFREKNHNFNKHAKFIIKDKLTNTKKPKEILRQRLIQRENFWIQTLDKIYPKGLNVYMYMCIYVYIHTYIHMYNHKMMSNITNSTYPLKTATVENSWENSSFSLILSQLHMYIYVCVWCVCVRMSLYINIYIYMHI